MNLPEHYVDKIKDFFAEHKMVVEIRNNEIRDSSKAEQCNVSIMMAGDSYPVANFELRTMVGCCGIVISTNCWVQHGYTGKRFGTFLHKLRIDIAKEWGYGLLLCTDVDSNEVQKRILKTHGWNQVDQFRNPRTDNIVNIHTFRLV